MHKRLIAGLTLAGCCVLLAPATAAHPRAWHHNHKRSPSVVIVVGAGSPAKRAAVVTGAPRGVLDLNVKPKATKVFVDGRLRGTCAEFDGTPGKLHLPAGLHDIKLVLPDGTEVERQVRVRAGVELNVGLDLR